MATRTLLTGEQRRAASKDGYFVVEGVITLQECERFLQRLDDYGHGRRAPQQGMVIEREPRVRRGELSAESGADVRKISGIGAGDDIFRGLVLNPAIVARMQELMSSNLKLFRADALMKPAGVGSAKGMHQDSPYWPIEPMALWSCWMPFEPAMLENGCMTAIPGSHKRGALPHEHVTDDYVIPEAHYDGERGGGDSDGAWQRADFPQPADARHCGEQVGDDAPGDHYELHGDGVPVYRNNCGKPESAPAAGVHAREWGGCHGWCVGERFTLYMPNWADQRHDPMNTVHHPANNQYCPLSLLVRVHLW